jgi:carbonic anhydrase
MVQENVIAQLNNIKTHPSVAVGLRDNVAPARLVLRY